MQEIVIGKDLVSVAELIGEGGEGAVYALNGRSGLAVKVYKPSLRAEREDKVRAMVGEGLAVKTDLVAYPGEVVTDRGGNFLGFAMRFMPGYRPLHELYSPKSRQRHFPKAEYRFIVHAALNVARAVGKVHQTGCVIGDLNHSGVLVAQDATVVLIDADSFQFTLNGKSYPCVVGVHDFTPPELHGKNLASVQRTIEHDNFGLAVAIFHLLFMGRHPYAGRYNGPDISMSDAIAQNRFAFSLTRQAATQTTPPPGSLTLDMFPDVISRAFENAFGLSPGARPTALDWIHVLTSLEGSLSHCSKFKTHYYPSSAGGCVWCKLTESSGFDMFPELTAVEPNISTDTRGTEQAIREILAFRFPTVADLLPAVATTRGASNALREARRERRGRALSGLLMMAGAVAGFIFAAPAALVWIGLAIWGWFKFSDREVESGPFQQAFKEADERVQRELNAFLQRNGMTEVMKVHSDLEVAIAAYKGHDDMIARELMVMKSNRESRQRQAYLDRFSIRHANISGIGPAKTATLISFGIETAADVDQIAVRWIPGFGDVMTRKLVAWRREHEFRFKYDPTPNAQDVADERALRGRFAAEKAKLESAIRNGLGTLRNAKARLDALPAKARSDRALTDALAARAQAEQDLRELGVSAPASTVALIGTSPPKLASQPPRAPLVTAPTPPRVTHTSSGAAGQFGTQSTPGQSKGGNGAYWFWGLVGLVILVRMFNVEEQDHTSERRTTYVPAGERTDSPHRPNMPTPPAVKNTPTVEGAGSTPIGAYQPRANTISPAPPNIVREPPRVPGTVTPNPSPISAPTVPILPSTVQQAGYDREIVRRIQQELNARGYVSGPEDGILGKRTSAAIAEFERDNHFTVNGVPNNAVLAAIISSGPRPEKKPHISRTAPTNWGTARSSLGISASRSDDSHAIPDRSERLWEPSARSSSEIREQEMSRAATAVPPSGSQGPSLIGLPYQEARRISNECDLKIGPNDASRYRACLEAALRRRANLPYEARRR